LSIRHGDIVLEPFQKSTLTDWFSTPQGEYVLQWERAQYDTAVEDVFGFHAVQVGMPRIDFLRTNRMACRVAVGMEPGCAVRAIPTELPFESASIDLLVLPHVLEFADEPHRILREAERVLVPEGQIVISGFNPLSLWGLKRTLSRRRTDHPWRGDFIGLLRLRDWLKLLGFELNGGRFGCYAPPARQAKWLDRWQFLEKAGDRWWPITGAVYVVRAVKRVHGMRIVLPDWKAARPSVPALAGVARREPQAARVRRADVHLRLVPGGGPDHERDGA
jgi:SAM-dependent methyltransferase